VGKGTVLGGGVPEALEVTGKGKPGRSQVVGKPIQAIKLPQGTSISAIVRGDAVVQAHHDTVVQENDHVILFMTDRRHINDIARLFRARD